MLYQLAIALGSGLASAVLFLVPAKGSMAALFFGVLAPLPLMIAALGFGPRSAGLAALTGTVTIAAVLHPYLAGAFAFSVVVPAILLGWQTLRRNTLHGRWTSPAALLIWIVVLTIAMDYAGIAVMAVRYQSFDVAVSEFAARLAPMVAGVLGSSDTSSVSPLEFARVMVLAMAPIAAAWGVVALTLNLWLAARIAQISGRLTRPWQSLPENLKLPREALFFFIGALGLTLGLSDFPRILASTMAAALGMAFALYGLAVVHRRTRKTGARAGLLGALYVAIFALFPWPLVAVATAGIFDVFRPRAAVANPTSKSTEII